MTTALIYARASLDARGEGQSVARQEEACRALARARGWRVVRVEVDNSISAYGGKERPGWSRVLRAIEGREVDVVVAWHLDRMTRSMLDLERLILLADGAGVGVATATGDIDLTTDTGRMVARILGAVARAEVERKAARQALANAQRASQGLPHSGGVRTFGYTANGREIVPEEAQAVREAARDVLAGEPLARIAKRWKAAGLNSSRGGWTAKGVRGVLLNPRHAGIRAYRGEVVGRGVWAAILDEETHLALKVRLEDPRRTMRADTRLGRAPSTLLSGIARCGACGGVMSGSSTRGVLTYACRAGKCATVPREIADVEVVGWVVDRLSRPDALAELVPGGDEDVEEARAAAVAARERLDGLAEAYAAGEITRAQLTAGTVRLRAALETAEGTLAAVGVGEVLGDLAGVEDVVAAWEAAPLARKRAAVDALLEVEVMPSKVEGLKVRVADKTPPSM